MFSQLPLLLYCLTFCMLTLLVHPVLGVDATTENHSNHHHSHDDTVDYNSNDSGHSMSGHHMHMDMNGTDSDMDMPMMRPYFHFDLNDTILFKSWILETSTSTIIACIIFFILAVLYEGLKSYREFLITRISSKRCYSVSVINFASGRGESNGCPEACTTTGGGSTLDDNTTEKRSQENVTCEMWSWSHVYQALLHVLQVAVSYTLMLGFMSFNVWICLAIALGAGQGYFLFCWKRVAVIMTDHCN